MHELLDSLRRAAPEWVSGEGWGRERGISRVTVSKRIRRLVEAGYEIESSPRKGYRLLREPEDLSEASMRPRLRGTRFAEGHYLYKERTGSTNDDLRSLAREGAPEGSLVVADIQEKGRGRMGRDWFGRSRHALQMSLLLRPELPPREGTWLPLLAAVAVRRAAERLGVPGAGIKWPNDVLVQGRKLCGILCEMSVDMDRIEFAILGLGLNVNTPLSDFPADLRGTACSIASVTGAPVSRARTMEAVLREMDARLALVGEGRGGEVLDEWRRTSVTLGREVEVSPSRGDPIVGVAEDVAENGALRVRDAGGRLHTLHSGEVTLRKGAGS